MILVAMVPRLISEDYMQHDQPIFDFRLIPGRKRQAPAFTCSIHLPGTPIDGLVGPEAPDQHLARRSASFEAIARLLALGLLDYQVVPLPASQALHVGGLQKLEEAKIIGTRRYLLKKPEFWSNGNQGNITTVYPTIIRVTHKSQNYAPLVLLTRQPLQLPATFNLFMDHASMVVHTQVGAPFTVIDEQCAVLRLFTLRIYRSILNKPCECELQNMTHFLACLSRSANLENLWANLPCPIDGFLDWEHMKEAGEKWAVPIRFETLEALREDMEDAVLTDRWVEFTRRYHVVAVLLDKTPLSKPEPGEVRDLDPLSRFISAH